MFIVLEQSSGLMYDLLEYLCPPQTQNHQTRKRRSDRSVETAAERPPKRARLTEKNLKALEKMGRPRKDPNPKSKSSRSDPNLSRSETKSKSSATTGSTSKTVSTTDSRFPRLAFQNGVLDPVHSTLPENLGCLQEHRNRARDTVSPTESEYKKFARWIRRAPNETTIVVATSTLLKLPEGGYDRVYNHVFNDFPKNVGFNNGLSATRPDMIEGLEMTEFYPFPVRQELGGAAVPTQEPVPLTLPHLAGEWKGPGKDMKLAETQAAYDGASMVYARDEACSFLGSPDPAGHAYIQTFTTDGTNLNTFAHYSTESQGQVKYHQYLTSSSCLISSYEDYKMSRRRLRNLQDAAKEASESLRDKLNEKWLANQDQPPASTSVPAETIQQHQPPVSTAPPTETVDVRDGYDYGDEGDGGASCQLLAEAEYCTSFKDLDGYNPPYTQQPLRSDYENGPTDTALGHSPTDGPQVLATDDGYNPDTSHAQNYDPPVTRPYSSENVLLPLESGVDDSNTCGQRRTRQSRGLTDDSTVRKRRKRR